MNLDDYLPPHPVLPDIRFWEPICIHKHAVVPLLPYSDQLLEPGPFLPANCDFDAASEEEIARWDATWFNVGLLCGKPSGVTVLQVTFGPAIV